MNLPLRQMGGGAEGNAENGSVHIVCSQDPQDPCGCPRPASGEGGRGPTHREEGKNKGKLYTSTFTDTPMFHTGIHPYYNGSYWHTPIPPGFIHPYYNIWLHTSFTMIHVMHNSQCYLLQSLAS